MPRKENNRITIVDLARMAGVNPSTVSRALSGAAVVTDETRARIEELAKRTGYVANHGARMLRSRRAGQILVIVPNIAASFYPEVLLGVEEALDGKAFGVIVGSTRGSVERETSLAKELLTGSADGLLLLGGQLHSDLINLPQYRRRIIALSRPVPDAGIACVGIDNRAAASEATRHFILLGRREIVHLAGPHNSPVFAARVDGFMDAMREAGLEDKASVVTLSRFNIAAGRQAMLDLLAVGRLPQAILCGSDELAFGAMQIARQRGLLLPEDIGFIGFDDHPISEAFEPALTTIAVPKREIGLKGAEMLLASLNDDRCSPHNMTLSYELIVRRSCGARIGAVFDLNARSDQISEK